MLFVLRPAKACNEKCNAHSQEMIETYQEIIG